ncbi:bifunctional folylpolyglutamate synthase/dihydrofolate synthase [Rhodohalobacter mucosus]|nr:folylpolyglutamate synthase/dihydrofolate synthase family protein [Rhodohalobacter mucosus]
MRFETIEQVEKYLESIPKFGLTGSGAANFNLDRMIRFCSRLGNPQDRFPCIHVAGTNGKGTVCQMLAAVYQTAGYRTGLYTSPHLLDVKERFRINAEEIDDSSLLAFFRENDALIAEEKLTYFELTTVIAFWYFSREKVDIAILETGLGGRLDATNVVNPLVSVITSIGMDHADILGDSIEKIAAEKAGIIKPGKPFVIGNLKKKAREVICRIAAEKGAECLEADTARPVVEDDTFQFEGTGRYKGVRFHSSAEGRKRIDAINAAMTMMATERACERLMVKPEAITEGIERLNSLFPRHAHFERLLPDVEWYFDGAHNAESVEILIDELLSRAPAHEWTVVLSFMSDKLTGEVASLWNRFPRILYYVQDRERAAREEQMKRHFPEGEQITDLKEVFSREQELSKSELVIFSGSFYFYEKIRRWMGTMSA